ncbi:MAG: hypothetical protein JKX76_00815 [Colwellia sp.]|nr:hypothetical protein [Colwellia sp.]
MNITVFLKCLNIHNKSTIEYVVKNTRKTSLIHVFKERLNFKRFIYYAIKYSLFEIIDLWNDFDSYFNFKEIRFGSVQRKNILSLPDEAAGHFMICPLTKKSGHICKMITLIDVIHFAINNDYIEPCFICRIKTPISLSHHVPTLGRKLCFSCHKFSIHSKFEKNKITMLQYLYHKLVVLFKQFTAKDFLYICIHISFDLGNLNILIWVREISIEYNESLLYLGIQAPTIILYLVKNGYSKILIWCEKTCIFGFHIEEIVRIQSLVDIAIKNNQLKILKWIHGNYNLLPTKNHLDFAAEHGYINILIWASHQNVFPTQYGMNKACDNDHNKTLSWGKLQKKCLKRDHYNADRNITFFKMSKGPILPGRRSLFKKRIRDFRKKYNSLKNNFRILTLR